MCGKEVLLKYGLGFLYGIRIGVVT